jgi:predicted ATP-grasp superfamily ATP-dependent carboligase
MVLSVLNVQVLGTSKKIVETSSRWKRKALHATLSDNSSKDQRIFALIAPHADSEESQSSDEEELKEAYGILYIKFTKLRETNQKNLKELNTMKTEKSTLLQKIMD